MADERRIAGERTSETQGRQLDEERRKRRRAWTVAGVAGLLGLLAFFWALQQRNVAEEQKREAEAARQDALDNERRAEEARRKAEQAQAAAFLYRDSAQTALQLSEEARQQAEARARQARLALADLQQASDRVAERLIEDATELIYETNHPEALEKLRVAIPLNKRTDEIARGLMELAFFYNEAGNQALALGIVDTVLQLRSSGQARQLYRQAVSSVAPRALLNQALKALDAEWVDALEKRYYPEMVEVPGSTFCFGSLVAPEDCDTSKYELITLDDFRIARTETTVWQYYLYATATGLELEVPTWGWAGDNPVVNVSWFDAIAYSNWLSAQRGVDPVYQLNEGAQDPRDLDDPSINWSEVPNWKANGFRLPTEAEWEYAARGGVRQDPFLYSGSNSLNSVGWYDGNSDEMFGVKRTHPVAGKQPNGIGLYDMSGNVWEWTWEADNTPAMRGGSWGYYDIDSRIILREGLYFPHYKYSASGFRVAQGLSSR